ncbi:UNVERIFIED_CONTAM: hypothetical protein FKN15_049926 [Acipenser sinensis]
MGQVFLNFDLEVKCFLQTLYVTSFTCVAMTSMTDLVCETQGVKDRWLQVIKPTV